MPPSVTLAGNDRNSIQQALNTLADAIARTPGFSAVESVFVFQPGGTAGLNVYTDWASLVSAASASAGTKLVCFDDSFGPCSIPEGVWRFGSYTIFQGRQIGMGAAPCALAFEKGAQLADVYEFHMLTIDNMSNVPVLLTSIYGASGFLVFRLGHRSSLISTGSAAFYSANSGGPGAFWWITEDSRLLTSAGPVPCLETQGRGTFLQVIATDVANVEEFTLRKYPNTTINGIISNAAAFISDNQLPARIPVTLGELAERVSYTADPANWRTPPTTVQEAITMIAAALGPI